MESLVSVEQIVMKKQQHSVGAFLRARVRRIWTVGQQTFDAFEKAVPHYFMVDEYSFWKNEKTEQMSAKRIWLCVVDGLLYFLPVCRLIKNNGKFGKCVYVCNITTEQETGSRLSLRIEAGCPKNGGTLHVD